MRFDRNETLSEARERNVRDALFEDLGRSDWTGRLVPEGRRVRARVVVREEAVLCGREWFESCLLSLDPDASMHWRHDEGARMMPGDTVCEMEADGRASARPPGTRRCRAPGSRSRPAARSSPSTGSVRSSCRWRCCPRWVPR